MATRYPVTSDFVSLRDVFDRFMTDVVSSGPSRQAWSAAVNGATRFALPVDVYATANEVVIIAAVPGLEASDIEITIDKNTVTLRGKIANVAQAEQTEGATWYLHELPRGEFSRSLTVPVDIDSASAEAVFHNGVLNLRLPVAETAKPRKIQVHTAAPEAIESTIS